MVHMQLNYTPESTHYYDVLLTVVRVRYIKYEPIGTETSACYSYTTLLQSFIRHDHHQWDY